MSKIAICFLKNIYYNNYHIVFLGTFLHFKHENRAGSEADCEYPLYCIQENVTNIGVV